ncbi:MAG TPA: PHP domain-containing protein [Candidatus Deferrimicrobium sp.]|nr:PHP domain-containing protein [Candidatus Deferrimicrobium sp.]
MDWNSFKQHKFLTFITACFVGWIIFLLILGLTNTRIVIFYDVLSQTDVSSNYSSTIPLLRYFLEPIVGTTFIFRYLVDSILIIFVGYVAIRVIYVVFQKKNMIKSEKFKLFIIIAKNYLTFAFTVYFLILIGIISVLLIGFFMEGFVFLNNNWMLSVQIGLTIGLILILLKLAFIIIKLVHPRLRLSYKVQKPPQSSIKKFFFLSGTELKYLLCFFLIFATFAVLLIATPFPTQKIEADRDNDEFLFDFHVHTYFSDGFLSPEERVDWYIAQGIDGAVFTDHENQRGYQRALDYVTKKGVNFTVLMGEEYTCHAIDIHLNYFGLNETIIPIEYAEPYGPLALNVSDMIQYVKSKGGWVTVNHYSDTPGTPYTYVQLRDWGVDGFEVINDGIEFPTAIREFCISNNLICLAGSDIHTNQELHTFVKLRLNDPSNKTLASIFENLQRNDHETVLIQLYPEKVPVINFLGITGFIGNVLNYFLNLDFFQILSWIIWSCLGFIFLMICYKVIKKANLKRLRVKILEEL